MWKIICTVYDSCGVSIWMYNLRKDFQLERKQCRFSWQPRKEWRTQRKILFESWAHVKMYHVIHSSVLEILSKKLNTKMDKKKKSFIFTQKDSAVPLYFFPRNLACLAWKLAHFSLFLILSFDQHSASFLYFFWNCTCYRVFHFLPYLKKWAYSSFTCF